MHDMSRSLLKSCGLLGLCAVLASCGGGGGGGDAPVNGGGATSGRAEIVGYVVDDALLGARVKLYALGDSTPAFETLTSEQGRFVIPATMANGDYRLEVTGGVVDSDGLLATTFDQHPFTGTLAAMLSMGAVTREAILVGAASTGLTAYAAGDMARYTRAFDALAAQAPALVTIASGDPTQAVRLTAATQRTLGWDAIVDELGDDGAFTASRTPLGEAQVSSVVAAAATTGALAVLSDFNMRICVADALEKEAASVTAADLRGLVRLECNERGITDVTGVAATLPSLQYLHVEDNLIGDITPLAGLTRLKLLNIRNNRVPTLQPLLASRTVPLALMVAENCITNATELNDTAQVNFSGYDLRARRQYSNCVKDSIELLGFALRQRTDGQHVLTYRSTYNPLATCSIDWGDGSSQSALCDGQTHFPTHTYGPGASITLRFRANDLVVGQIAVTLPAGSLVTEGVGYDRDALVKPNGGEIWLYGTTQEVVWMPQWITGATVDLYVLHDDPVGMGDKNDPQMARTINTKRWYQFGSAVANTGSWRGDPVLLRGTGNAYKVLVVSTTDRSKFDLSDGTFSLLPEAPAVLVATPTGATPGGSSVGSSVVLPPDATLTWNDSQGAEAYTVNLLDINLGVSLDIYRGPQERTLTLPTVQHNGSAFVVPGHSYQWRVAATSFAAGSSSPYSSWLYFTVPDAALTAPPTPTGTAPGNTTAQGALLGFGASLRWASTTTVTSHVLRLIDINSGGYVDTTLPEGQLTFDLTTPVLLNGQTLLQSGRVYDWSVSACRQVACSSFSSPLRFNLAVAKTLPAAPTGTAPGNQTASGPILGGDAVMHWDAVAGATRYQVVFIDVQTGGQQASVSLTGASLTLGTVSLVGGLRVYEWAVAACNDNGCSGYSSFLRFRRQ